MQYYVVHSLPYINYTIEGKKLNTSYKTPHKLVRLPSSFLPIFLLLFFASSLYAEKYTIGGKHGWKDISKKEGLTYTVGHYGYDALSLDTLSNTPNDTTDLYIDFENSTFLDLSKNYEILSNTLYLAQSAVKGHSAGYSRGGEGGLTLKGKSNAFFSIDGRVGSFVIDFYLSPSIVENGEVILNWRSTFNDSDASTYQIISFIFYQNKLTCLFSNIFYAYKANNGEVSISGKEKLVPNKWSHHTIRFNEDSGLLSYVVDGKTEDLLYITDTGHEGGSVYPVILGTPASVDICPKYTGLIDDLYIGKALYKEPVLESDKMLDTESLTQSKYLNGGHSFVTSPLLFPPSTTIKSVEVDSYESTDTQISIYLRGGENQYNWNDTYPEWILIKNGEELEGIKGNYFQVKGVLYTNGEGNITPILSSVTLNYLPLAAPLPPYKVKVSKKDKGVNLSWQPSVSENVGGYYIYYGTKPGEYLGNTAEEGASPIDVGQKTSYNLSGLRNGVLYYFVITTYSSLDKSVVGGASHEVYARPNVK